MLVAVGGMVGCGSGEPTIDSTGATGAVQASGAWQSLPAPTYFNGTLTLLHDGQALAVGGVDQGGNPTSTARKFDPATGAWTQTQSMNLTRYYHTATMLRSGRVMVVGGESTGRVELYDPLTGTWSFAAKAGVERYSHNATLLSDGRVLVTGGADHTGTPTASAQVYDPVLDQWTPTVNAMSVPRASHTSTALPDGTVLHAGGNSGSRITSSTDLYDPATNAFTPSTPMSIERSEHVAVLLPDGTILVAGTEQRNGGTPETFDPATRRWTATQSFALSPDRGQSASLMPDGRAVVIGDDDASLRQQLTAYDPATRAWSTGTYPVPEGRRYFNNGTLLSGGRLLLVGGTYVPPDVASGASPALRNGVVFDANLYTPPGRWSAQPPMPMPIGPQIAVPLLTGQVLLVGGGSSPSTKLFDPGARQLDWTTVGAPAVSRAWPKATLLPSGQVLVAGGAMPGAQRSAELFDPASGTWRSTGPMSQPFSGGHAMTLLASGQVLATGSGESPDDDYLPLSPCRAASTASELFTYDAAARTGSWRPTTTQLNTPRCGHVALLLPNGQVLVAGGVTRIDGDVARYTDQAELFDPRSGRWQVSTPMPVTCPAPLATMLGDDSILVVCNGLDGATHPPTAQRFRWDPVAKTGQWERLAAPPGSHALGSLSLLPNGHVLLAGGMSMSASGIGNSTDVHLFDPITKTWRLAVPLGKARSAHSALPSPSGLLVVGGYSDTTGPSPSNTTGWELYEPGIVSQASQQPLITSATPPASAGGRVGVLGSLFTGVSGSSGSNGWQNSPTSYPIVQLRRTDSGQTRFLLADPASGWTDTSFGSIPVTDFPGGPATVTVFTNGIASPAFALVMP